MIIISGIQPGRTGTARVMSHLVQEESRHTDHKVRFLFGPVDDASIKLLIIKPDIYKALQVIWRKREIIRHLTNSLKNKAVINEERLIIIHPQTLGFKRCLDFIKSRSKPVWLFLMDSSFFCIRSYNYIPGEDSACLRCLGGDFTNIKKHNCKPFPVNDSSALEFVKKLKNYVASRQVKILVQSSNQATLARKHFGPDAIIRTCGIWGDDWDVTTPGIIKKNVESKNGLRPAYDIVFHGPHFPAKGARWAISVAERCPETSFFFPFNKLLSGFSSLLRFAGRRPPGNLSFVPMTWDTGLREALCSAKLVLVPSLWSAPVEGSLIKSIALCNRVAVVDNPTAFSSEIPRNIILQLPSNIEKSAEIIKSTLKSDWTPDEKECHQWYRSFVNDNAQLLDRLIKQVTR